MLGSKALVRPSGLILYIVIRSLLRGWWCILCSSGTVLGSVNRLLVKLSIKCLL